MSTDESRRHDVQNSIADVSDRNYHRGLTVALFVGDVLAGLYLLGITFAVFIQRWGDFGGGAIDPPRAFPMYWVVVVVLALITFGIIWNVVTEVRAGRRYVAGKVLVVLSFFPLLFGIAMLASTP
jgi:hypothetical protein